MANGTQMMWELSTQEQSQPQIVGVSDFLAKTLVSLGCNEDSLGIDHHSFSELCIYLENSGKEIDPNTCSLKMLKTLLVFTPALISEGYSLAWMRGGYNAEWRIINSKDHGVPQNRDRVFIVGHLRGRGTGEVLPIGTSYTEAAIVQGHGNIISNSLLSGDRRANGCYPIDGGGVVKVNGFHKE